MQVKITLKKSDVKYGILQSIPKQIDLKKINNKHILIKDLIGTTTGTIHRSLNRIDGLTKWHHERKTQPGNTLRITYNENEIERGLHVLNIEFLDQKTKTYQESNDAIQESNDAIQESNDAIQESNDAVQENNDAVLSFELEAQLENYLINNIGELESGLTLVEQQCKIGANKLDLLCRDKNNNYVVVEIKNRKTSDQVVGQILRYMGSVKESKNVETVRGIIITPEYDKNLEYAISMSPNISVKYFQLRIEFSD